MNGCDCSWQFILIERLFIQQEYFSTTIGPAKKVSLTYGPNGQSRGISTIVFSKPGSAAEAAKSLDGVKVDGRPMKVSFVFIIINVGRKFLLEERLKLLWVRRKRHHHHQSRV